MDSCSLCFSNKLILLVYGPQIEEGTYQWATNFFEKMHAEADHQMLS